MDKKYFDHFFPDSHVFGISEKYRAHQGRGSRLPQRDRIAHADRLLDEHKQILETAEENRKSRLDKSLPVMDGIQLEFVSKEGARLTFLGLEGRGKGVYLLNERYVKPEGAQPFQTATVHIPSSRGVPNAFFSDKIHQYRDKNTDSGSPQNDRLIRSIESIRLANLNSFWFGIDDEPPDEKTSIWCEVWLNRPDNPHKKIKKSQIKTNSIERGGTDNSAPSDVVARFQRVCSQLEIECRPNALHFPEQEVLLVRANGVQLQGLVDSVEMLSSISRYSEPATFFLDMLPREQPEWIADMRSRLAVHPNPTSSVCILDTGVNNAHPLLAQIIPDKNRYSVNLDDDVADFRNVSKAHGTEMSGVVAFGDLSDAMAGTRRLTVDHAVESVKILFENKESPDELFGQITDRAISIAETDNPDYKRVACLAVTAESQIDGTPSSWSASIDQLAFGDELDNESGSGTEEAPPIHKRLFVVSAGNVDNPTDWANYPISNISAAVQDPAQSWNALTVGAYTNKTEITEQGTEGYTTVAPADALSPVSRTSVTWDHQRWPLKPDIVLEGGNAAKSPQGKITDFESLSVLTTASNWASNGNHFAPFRGTSPATAQAARMAAKIYAICPQAWPETVRGLLVHSARWTDTMLPKNSQIKKSVIQELLRTVGYGVPVFERALHSTRNSFTMILQDNLLQPYTNEGTGWKYNNIRLFEVPWPQDILRELGNTNAEIRITLSYFIAPSPGRKGWGNRYRYPSHGLRFDMNNVSEDRATFVERLNAKEKGDDDSEDANENDAGSSRWLVGANLRHRGSIHTDIWRGSAVDMVNTRFVAVYPTGGWWKERPQFGHGERSVRFSLLVSLDVPETVSVGGVPVDLYTPVQQEIKTRTEVAIPVGTQVSVTR